MEKKIVQHVEHLVTSICSNLSTTERSNLCSKIINYGIVTYLSFYNIICLFVNYDCIDLI